MQWFRFYAEVVHDPKVQLLPPKIFKTWVNLLCLACSMEGEIRRDCIPFYLRLSDQDVLDHINELLSNGLLEEEGDILRPHSWKQRQYISDNGKARVKRHREKRKSMGLPAQNWIKPVTREAVYMRDNYKCVYCNSVTDLTVDHKIPEGRGGKHNFDNFQTTCRACNARKRDLTDDEYRSRNGLVTQLVTSPDYREQIQNRTEADKESKKAAALLSARDLTNFQKIYDAGIAVLPALTTASTSIIHQWLADAVSAEQDAIPEIERLAKSNPRIRSWGYFTGAVMDAKATRLTPLPEGKPYGINGKNNISDHKPTKDERARAAVMRAAERLGFVDTTQP